MTAELPALRGAVADVGADQLRLIADLHNDRRCRRELPSFAALLTELARDLVHADFITAVQRWRSHVDADGSHRASVRCRQQRHVHSATIGHEFALHVEGDTLTGAIIIEILNEHEHAEFLSDVAERDERYGNDSSLYPLARTRSQRRYDALVQIFLKAAATTDVTSRMPLVNLVTTPEGLEQSLKHLLPVSETAAGAAVDPHQLAMAALIGRVRRVAVDPTGRVTAVGRRRRLFAGSAREAVLLTSGRCCFPACPIDTDLQIDHVTPWPRSGGGTDPSNGGAICGHHNRFKHTQRITVTRDESGWHHFRSDGTEIAPRGSATGLMQRSAADECWHDLADLAL